MKRTGAKCGTWHITQQILDMPLAMLYIMPQEGGQFVGERG